jgi:hypothetical protein
MAQAESHFKTKEEYAAEAAKLDVVFKFVTADGEIPLDQRGTPEELQAQLVAVNKDGLTLPNQKGFEWYPITSIRKVIVEHK